jgi:hypothetical protein
MSANGRDTLLAWCQKQTKGYRGVNIKDFRGSWQDGLAFCALLHKIAPNLMPFEELSAENRKYNLDLALDTAEKIGIPRLFEAEDIYAVSSPNQLAIITYLIQYAVGVFCFELALSLNFAVIFFFNLCLPYSAQNFEFKMDPFPIQQSVDNSVILAIYGICLVALILCDCRSENPFSHRADTITISLELNRLILISINLQVKRTQFGYYLIYHKSKNGDDSHRCATRARARARFSGVRLMDRQWPYIVRSIHYCTNRSDADRRSETNARGIRREDTPLR